MSKRIICMVLSIIMVVGSCFTLPGMKLTNGSGCISLAISEVKTDTNSAFEVQGVYKDGGTGKTVFDTAVYNDNYFKLSNIEQGGLARLSMLASAAVYKVDYIKTLFANCNFSKIKNVYSGKYASKKSDKVSKPTKKSNDHVKLCFAIKRGVEFDEGSNGVLVAIAIKGTSGDYEWMSNFNIGTGATHKGFNIATKETISALNDYLKKNGLLTKKNEIKEKLRFWVIGHSRGAAVGNLVAKNLTECYGIDNVFAYTFATPRVSINGKKSGYENIYNYLNPGDFVTEVAPCVEGTKWKYKRYGNDITFDENTKEKMSELFYSKTYTLYEGFNSAEKYELVDRFIKYVGNNVKSYYKFKKYRKIIKYKPVHFFRNGLGCALAGKGLIGKITGIGFKDLQGDGLSKALDIAALDKNAQSVLAYMVNAQVFSSKFGHAHTQSSYMGWLNVMYPDSGIVPDNNVDGIERCKKGERSKVLDTIERDIRLPLPESIEWIPVTTPQDCCGLEISITEPNDGKFDASLNYGIFSGADDDAKAVDERGISTYSSDAFDKDDIATMTTKEKGTYFVRITNACYTNPYYYGKNKTNMNTLHVKINIMSNDENEYNDSWQRAVQLNDKQEKSFLLVGELDKDYFSIDIDEPGKIEIGIRSDEKDANFNQPIGYRLVKIEDDGSEKRVFGCGDSLSGGFNNESIKEYSIDEGGRYYICVANGRIWNSIYYTSGDDNKKPLYIYYKYTSKNSETKS